MCKTKNWPFCSLRYWHLNAKTVCIMSQNSLRKFAPQLWEWLQFINQGSIMHWLCEVFSNFLKQTIQRQNASASLYMWLAYQFSFKWPFSFLKKFSVFYRMPLFPWFLLNTLTLHIYTYICIYGQFLYVAAYVFL